MKKTLYINSLERLRKFIKAHGMRPSVVRDAVLEQACMLQQPFTANELLKACQEQRISIGTVYNALNVFISAQILSATNRQRGQGSTEYEICSGYTKLKVICLTCGKTTEIHDKAITRLIRERKYTNYHMTHFHLYIYGECKLCQIQNDHTNK